MPTALEFATHHDCTECPLYAGATCPGLPTRLSDFGDTEKDTALLFLGEAPGYFEDAKGKSWVGYAGQLLHKFIEGAHLTDHAVVYLANVCRCRPPQNATPTDAQAKECRKHLEADLRTLLGAYKRVIIFALGAPAASACGRKSVKDAIHFQGHPIAMFKDVRVPVFYTYHPATLAPSRNPDLKRKGGPSLADAIQAHFFLVLNVLSGKQAILPDAAEYDIAPPLPNPMPDLISLDIETYGILVGQSQTVFHPVKSEVVDGIKPPDQVVLVTIGYETPDRGDRAAVFRWDDSFHRVLLYQWLAPICRDHSTILGQNIVFDMMYLRYNSPLLRRILAHGGPRLDDIQLINHLQYELRPERGLKPLSELFGVANYTAIGSMFTPEGRAKSSRDKRLHLYSATDVVAPLRLRRLLFDGIRHTYGEHSTKLTPACSDFRNDLLWTALHMSEAGVALDRSRVQVVHDEYTVKVAAIIAEARTKHGLILSGTGANTSRREAMHTALGSHLSDMRVAWTPKTRELSFGKENINLALALLPSGNPARGPIESLRAYAETSYIPTHYTGPLLTDPREGFVVGNLVYPSWYLVPSAHDKLSDSEDERGTIQGRPTCSKPPLQTYPPPLEACYTSAFPGGRLLVVDMSQLELRVAALLSGDPVLLAAYREGRDLHSEMAHRLFPNASEDDPLWTSVYRQVGKRANFLMIFLGGAIRLKDTLRKFIGRVVDVDEMFPPHECDRIIAMQHEIYYVFYAWHDALVRQVSRDGFLEMPTGWGRTFVGSERDVRTTYEKEIANCPIQMAAAQLVLSAEAAIIGIIEQERLRSRVRLNVYDSLMIDSPTEEAVRVRELVHIPLTRPPLLPILEQAYGHTVPLAYEVKNVGIAAEAAAP